MRSRTTLRDWNGLTVAGIVPRSSGGLGWFVARELRLDPLAVVGSAGWPIFAISPAS